MKPLFWLNKYWHANRVLFEMKEDYESERERERMAAFTHNSGSIMSNAYVNELMKRSHMMADCMSICCVSLPNQNLISMGFCDLWTKFRRTDRQTNNHVFNSVELHTRHTLKKRHKQTPNVGVLLFSLFPPLRPILIRGRNVCALAFYDYDINKPHLNR